MLFHHDPMRSTSDALDAMLKQVKKQRKNTIAAREGLTIRLDSRSVPQQAGVQRRGSQETESRITKAELIGVIQRPDCLTSRPFLILVPFDELRSSSMAKF